MINSKHPFKTNSHQFKPSDLDKIQQLTQSFSPLNHQLKPCLYSSNLQTSPFITIIFNLATRTHLNHRFATRIFWRQNQCLIIQRLTNSSPDQHPTLSTINNPLWQSKPCSIHNDTNNRKNRPDTRQKFSAERRKLTSRNYLDRKKKKKKKNSTRDRENQARDNRARKEGNLHRFSGASTSLNLAMSNTNSRLHCRSPLEHKAPIAVLPK